MPKYLYALVPTGTKIDPALTGLDGAPVALVECGELACVASEIQGKRLRPERARLAAHHQVLKGLLVTTTPVPMAFGTVVDSNDKILALVTRHRDSFVEQLEQVSGMVEMGLKVTWDVPNIFEYFLGSDTELRERRDQIFYGNREPSHSEKLELGRVFDRALTQAREDHADAVLAILAPICKDIRRNPSRAERDVMNLACLVARQGMDAFETSIFEAAALFDNSFAFDYSGPWAPHNFVSLHLEAED